MTRRAMEFIARGRRRALVPAPVLHQAALALHRARALQRHVRRRRTCCPPCAREDGARRSASGLPRVHGAARRARPSRATRCATRSIPVYMGLIKQIDDQLGRAVRASCDERGLLDNTMIVFTSDHGDYLGDHWLGEKDLFHEPSVKVPLIVFDPSPRGRRDARHACATSWSRRSTWCRRSSRSWAATRPQQSHRLEGRSLLPFLRGEPPAAWRRYAISEYDYSMLPAAAKLGVEPRDARLFMVADKRWKFIHAWLPADAVRHGGGPGRVARSRRRSGMRPSARRLTAALHDWGLRQSQRTTRLRASKPNARQVAAQGHPDRRVGRGRAAGGAVEPVSGRGA